MIEVTFRMSAATTGNDPVLAVTSWLGTLLLECAIANMTVHELRIEEVDA
jgi:hypothetical protein